MWTVTVVFSGMFNIITNKKVVQSDRERHMFTSEYGGERA